MVKRKSIFNHFLLDAGCIVMRHKPDADELQRFVLKGWNFFRSSIPGKLRHDYDMKIAEVAFEAGYERALRDNRIGKYHDKNEINRL